MQNVISYYNMRKKLLRYALSILLHYRPVITLSFYYIFCYIMRRCYIMRSCYIISSYRPT